MSYGFAIGQKVVCVDASTAPGRVFTRGEKFPVTGGIYTVRDVYPYMDRLCLHLVEVVNAPGIYLEGDKSVYGEPGFSASRFRPVEPKSAELFRAIAADPSKFTFTPFKRERERVRT